RHRAVRSGVRGAPRPARAARHRDVVRPDGLLLHPEGARPAAGVRDRAPVAGLKVVFADVDPATFTMDPSALERVIGPETRAVVPTHLYGLACDMDAIMAIAERHH